MPLIDLRRDGPVFVLTMNAGENRFNAEFLAAFGAALDEVEGASGPAALVTTGGAEKFYSNGFDIGWVASGGGPAVQAVLRLLGRVLACPLPTVAAINGHAFAAGGMLALAHDYRVMRADRGFFCLPEVDINLPLQPGMTALIKSKLVPAVFRDAILTGARIGGAEASARGIVDEAVGAEDLVARAVARAGALAAKDRGTYAALKRGMYADVLALLEGAPGS